MKKLYVLFIFMLTTATLGGCSTLNINKNLSASKWNKILIIPVVGSTESNDAFESKFVYELGTTSYRFQVVDPDLVKAAYERIFPEGDSSHITLSEALIIAKEENASGIVYSTIKHSESNYVVSLSSTVKVIDVATENVIAISLQENDSMFFLNERNLFSSIAEDSAEEIKEVLVELSSM
jgi:hypothetical protein